MSNKTVTVKIGLTGGAQVEAGLARVGAAGKRAGADVAKGMSPANDAFRKTQTQTQALEQSTRKRAKTAEQLANEEVARQRRVGEAMGQSGRTIQRAGTIITGVLVASGAAAVNWESQYAGVTKTVDFSNKAFGTAAEQSDRLEGSLRNMARTMPTTHKDIAAVAEAAGQLGVATPDVAAFTKTMVQLGDTTNLTADEAATSLAQLMNVMGTAPEKVSNLGSVIVDLGNKGASTERDIVQMGQRIAGVGNQLGFSEDQVLSYASAIASTGINVEAGGTAISKSLLRMDDQVRKGGKGLETLAATSGMTAAEFKQAFETDAAGAVDTFVEGLGRVQASGGSVSAVLADIGIKGQYERDVMTRLAGATQAAGREQGLLTENLKNGAAAMKANTALTEEANKRYETSASKIKIAWNNIVDAGISAGGSLLPVIAQIAGDVAVVAAGFGKLPQPLQEFIVKAGLLVGVGLLVSGTLLRTAGAAITFAGAATTAAGGAGALTAGMVGLRGATAAALGPLAVIAGALLAVQAASSAMQRQLDTNSAGVDGYAKNLDDLATGGDQLDQSIKKWGSSTALAGQGVKDTTSFFEHLRDVQNPVAKGFDKIASAINVLPILDLKSSFGVVTEEANKLDEALVKMDPGEAKQAFAELAADAVKAGYSVQDLATVFPKYTEAVREGSKANVEIQQKTAALSQQYGVTRTALESLIGKQTLSAENSSKLADTLFAEGNSYQNAIAGRLGYKQAIDDSNKVIDSNAEKVKANGKALSENTQAGRDNKAALLNLASAGKGYVESLVRQGAGADKAGKALAGVRKEFVNAAVDAGLGGKAARALADDLGLIPKEVSVKFDLFGQALAQTQIAAFQTSLDALPPEQKTKILSIYEKDGAEAALSYLKKIDGSKAETKIETKSNTKEAVEKSNKEASKAKNQKRKIDYSENGKDAANKATKGASTAKNQKKSIKYDQNGKLIADKATKDSDKAKNQKKTITYTTNASNVAAAASSQAQKAQNVSRTITYRRVTLGKREAEAGWHGGMVGRDLVPTLLPFADGGSPDKRLKGKINEGSGRLGVDDVLGILGRYEWVVPRGPSQMYGDRKMEAVRSGTAKIITPDHPSYHAFVKGGPVGYAAGGKVDPVTARLLGVPINLLGEIATIARALAAANAKLKAPKARLDRANASYTRAVDRRDDLKVRIANLQKQASATKGVTKADRDLKKARNALAKQNTVVTKTSKEKTAATEAYNKVAEPSKELTARLTDAQKALADSTKAASDSFRDAYQSQSTDGRDWLDLANTGAAELDAFSKQITDLRARGLNEASVQRILAQATEQGVAVASETAASLVGGGKALIDQLNKANANLQRAADSLGYKQAVGVGRYDSGGWLMPGQTGVNHSGKPEPVFTNDQWKTLASFVSAPLGNRLAPAVQQRSTATAAQSAPITVYVQDPFSGQFLEAKIVQVADQRIVVQQQIKDREF